MDKSRPGHQARLPLIIERPDLTHPLQRVLALLFTSLAWLLWLVMWIPLLAALGRYLGYAVPEIVYPGHISLDTFLMLMRVTPWVVGIAVAIVMVSYLREKRKTLNRVSDERWRPLGMERLAAGAALDPEQLAKWQSAQVLYVEHGPRGRVVNANTVRPEGLD